MGGSVLIYLVALLFGCLCLFSLVSWTGPDGGGWSQLLFGLFFVSGSIVCLWGATQMRRGEKR